MGIVYLLHFSAPISPAHTCRHYLGYADDLQARLEAHRTGRGARLTQVALERGIAFELACWWPGDRTLERTLKNRKYGPRICPLCGHVSPRYHQLALDLTEPDWPVPPPPRSGLDRWEAMHLATRVPGGLTTFTPPAELPPDVLPW